MATIKQLKAIEHVVGNGGNVTKAMRDAEYSENTINTPQKLTESKAWEELMEEHLPDKDLAKVHKEGLKAGKKLIIKGKDSEESITLEEPDYAVRHKYLETGYKLKGKMKESFEEVKPEIHLHNTKINIIIEKNREEIKKQLGDD